jgi:hypothetical protein
MIKQSESRSKPVASAPKSGSSPAPGIVVLLAEPRSLVRYGLAGEEPDTATKLHGIAYWASVATALLFAGSLAISTLAGLAHGQTTLVQQTPIQQMKFGMVGEDIPCSQWISDLIRSKADTPTPSPDPQDFAGFMADMRWLFGFMTGVNYANAGHGDNAYVATTDSAQFEVINGVTRYCQQHPNAPTLEAATWIRHQLQVMNQQK